MDIYDIQKAHGFPIRTLRRLDKLGLLKCVKADDAAIKLKENLRAGRRLTAGQLIWLVKNPNRKGFEEYDAVLERRLDELGDVERDAFPPEVNAHIYGAAKREKASISALAKAIADFINRARDFKAGEERLHGWLAVRLLYNSSDKALPDDIKLLNSALMRVRQSPEFEGYWSKSDNGIVSYHSKKEFDI